MLPSRLNFINDYDQVLVLLRRHDHQSTFKNLLNLSLSRRYVTKRRKRRRGGKLGWLVARERGRTCRGQRRVHSVSRGWSTAGRFLLLGLSPKSIVPSFTAFVIPPSCSPFWFPLPPADSAAFVRGATASSSSTIELLVYLSGRVHVRCRDNGTHF